MHETIEMNSVYFQRGETVVVDGQVVGVITQCDSDGDVRVKTDEGSDFWFRTRLTKAKV